MEIGFIIQGEGRGHQTQAVALSEILVKNGHKVVFALAGTADIKKQSVLLKNCPNFEVLPFLSPSLAYNQKTKELSILKTVTDSLPRLPQYFKSLKVIKNMVETYQPDVIVNFYDFLGGIFSGFLNRFDVPVVCIGHQYLLLNSVFEYPQNQRLDRFFVNFNTKITSLKADKMLALSFRKFWSEKNIHTVPPLLRSELKLQEVYNENFILVYVTQPELITDVITQCKLYPEENFEMFVDLKDDIMLPANLKINPISNSLFLERMAACKGLISTAGFESVCEAMYLSKPVMMVPVKNHYEQKCNAFDGEMSGAGIFSENIDFGKFLNYLKSDKYQSKNHRKWFDQTENMFLNELESLVKGENLAIQK
ncbi:MAG: glycosyl transferase [Cytophagaceae bacterium]|nr:glycosyl transferase [Cytophagaceae bacterium]MBL0327041.1 glycosyl transferase [Cytophagaceae bacterium]